MPVVSHPHKRQVAGIYTKETMAHGHSDFKKTYSEQHITVELKSLLQLILS